MCLIEGRVFDFLYFTLGIPFLILCLNWGNLEMFLFLKGFFFLIIYIYILFMTKLHVV